MYLLSNEGLYIGQTYGTAVVLLVLVLVINLITDILYMVINPKVAIDAENGGM